MEQFGKSVKEIALNLIGVPRNERLKIISEEVKKLPEDQRNIASELIWMTLGSIETTMNVNVGVNYGQIGNVLENCTNIINKQADGESKELLKKLTAEVDALIKTLPDEKTKTNAAANFDWLVKAATDTKPKRPWYSVSAKGLLEASKFAKDFAGNIAGTIGQLGKLLWPDFKLEETEKD